MPASPDSPTVQLMKDYRTADVNRGSGLTNTAGGPYGSWHIHAIQDDEQLGKITSVFIRFEDRNLGDQHLMFDEDGNILKTNLNRASMSDLVKWGTGRVTAFLGNCADLGEKVLQARREKKAEDEKKKQEYIANLPALQEVKKHEYSGKQANLFGGSSSGAVGEEKALQLMQAAGIKPNHPDFISIKLKVKGAKPKSEWPKYIANYYDQIFPPLLEKISSEVEQEVSNANSNVPKKGEEKEKGGGLEPEKQLHKPPVIESKSNGPELLLEKKIEPKKVSRTVVEAIQKPKQGGGLQGALLQIGLPLAFIFVILAVILHFFG